MEPPGLGELGEMRVIGEQPAASRSRGGGEHQAVCRCPFLEPAQRLPCAVGVPGPDVRFDEIAAERYDVRRTESPFLRDAPCPVEVLGRGVEVTRSERGESEDGRHVDEHAVDAVGDGLPQRAIHPLPAGATSPRDASMRPSAASANPVAPTCWSS